ncbi:hypothetical protein L210DRAFT_3660565 [Boletus edulis BED1]|uniref:DUF6534 domain-containing protein n=1 Tax=Boletus edulis BED1 TaxID=1328754 RepID=A0AAD4GM18_BOLED|nr:hypothetical protein L210DRAFT_3660565 [Boletus edulis BED1]
MLLGVFLNCILYGVSMLDPTLKLRNRRDARWIKIFVLYLLFCETLNTACDTGMVFEPLIVHYGDSTPAYGINEDTQSRTTQVMISTPVQLFIAWRVKITSKSTVLPATISLFAIVSFVGGIATSVSVARSNEYPFFPKILGAMTTWLASSAAANVAITASLAHKLLCRRTRLAATDDLIDRIIQVTVHTGLITTVFSLIDDAVPDSFCSFRNYIWDFALSKLYSNSLLSILNARGGWKATSTFRDNALFGRETGGESMARSRTQVLFEHLCRSTLLTRTRADTS